MKVKIGDQIFDSDKKPIMLVLSEEEKNMLYNMSPESNEFHIYPSDRYWTYDKQGMENCLYNKPLGNV